MRAQPERPKTEVAAALPFESFYLCIRFELRSSGIILYSLNLMSNGQIAALQKLRKDGEYPGEKPRAAGTR